MTRTPVPRFLGLTAAERNARVLQRMPHLADGLTIPADVIITTDGALLDISTAPARRLAAWALLRASGKPTDGWLSRHIHRRISRLCTYVLLRLGLSANHATFLTLLVGVAAAWFLAQTSHATLITGTLLFWFASIADGIDGEMARLTLSESAYGEQLDTAVDHATHLLSLAGVMIGWWRQGIGPAGWTLAIGVGAGLPLVILWGMYFVRRAKGLDGQFFVDTKPIEFGIADAAAKTGAPALRLTSAIYAIFRREAIALTFFLVSLVTGARVVFPAMMAGGLLVVAAALLFYRDPISAAIRARA